jgi:hypothetical protein
VSENGTPFDTRGRMEKGKDEKECKGRGGKRTTKTTAGVGEEQRQGPWTGNPLVHVHSHRS